MAKKFTPGEYEALKNAQDSAREKQTKITAMEKRRQAVAFTPEELEFLRRTNKEISERKKKEWTQNLKEIDALQQACKRNNAAANFRRPDGPILSPTQVQLEREKDIEKEKMLKK